MNLNRSQLAILITGFSLGTVVLTLFNIHLGGSVEEEYVIEMSLAEEDIETLLEEELPEQTAQDQPDIKSHMALNETAKPSFGSPEPLKTLQELMEERSSDTGPESDDYLADAGEFASNLEEMAKRREEMRQQLGDKDSDKKEYTNYLKDKRTSISYSLVERNAYELPPPIYTCIEGGKVVINVEVDGLGYVVSADFNEHSSSTSNGCLVDNAIQYARRARFSPAADRPSQKGTITYLFISK